MVTARPPLLLPFVTSLEQLAPSLGCRPNEIGDLLDKINQGLAYRYMDIVIKRRRRLVAVPSDESLRSVQRHLLHLLRPLEVELLDCVHGYISARSTVSNARSHAGQYFQQRFDILDFFASVTTAAVQQTLLDFGVDSVPALVLARLTTVYDGLPLGACTSPALSNLVLRRIDAVLSNAADLAGLSYTRYADDQTFSGHYRFDLESVVADALAIRGLALNPAKTRSAKYGQSQYVTGLSTSDALRPRLPKTWKRKLRQELYLVHRFGFESFAEHAGLSEHRAVNYVAGKLRYAGTVEPELVRSLLVMYPRAAKEPRPSSRVTSDAIAARAASIRAGKESPALSYVSTVTYGFGD